MEENKILSIVIPTKNRYEYLNECIRTLVELKSTTNNIEIVVQDNSTDNSDFLAMAKDCLSDISYNYTLESLSVIENCNRAIENSSGEYVCMLGDDDSVADIIVDVVNWMKENNIESCIGNIIRYNWPDLIYKRHNFPSLSIPAVPNKVIEVSTAKELNKVMNQGAYSMRNLPKVYHAIVSKDALRRVKELSGSYFPGPSPDMANATALCLVLRNHILIDTPIIISGFSYKSGGGMGTRGAHIGKIEDIPHLPKDTSDKWEKLIPKIWSAETIYAESLLKALRNSNADNYISRFNYNAFYAAYISYNIEHWRLILPLITKLSSYFIICLHLILIFCLRLKNFFFNTLESKFGLSKKIISFDVNSLTDAVAYVNKYSKDKKFSHEK